MMERFGSPTRIESSSPRMDGTKRVEAEDLGLWWLVSRTTKHGTTHQAEGEEKPDLSPEALICGH